MTHSSDRTCRYPVPPSRVALAVALATSSFAALGQTLPEITVTADRPAGSFLSSEEIARLRRAHQDLVSILTEAPGVSALAGGTISTLPVVRGLADERLRVVIDGADLTATCPNHMNTPLSYVPSAAVESVTIYPSVTPVSVGGDAIGGAIIVNKRKAPFAPTGETIKGGEFATFYRSNGNGKSGEWGAWAGSDSFAAQYLGSVAQSDNYRAGGAFKDYTFTGRPGHTLPTDEVGSTAYLVRNHAVDFGWRRGEHELRLALAYQKQPYQLYPNQRMDLLDNEEKRGTLTYTGRFAWGELEAVAYAESVDHYMDFGADKRYWYGMQSGGGSALNGQACSPLGPTCAAGMPMYASSDTYGVKVKATVPVSTTATVRVGGEWNRYTLDDWWPPSGGGMWPNTFWNIKNGERTRTAAFAEWEQALTHRWQTELGVRFERVATSADPVQGYANTNGMAPMLNYQLRDSTAFNAGDRSQRDNNWNLVWRNTWKLDAQWQAGLDLARQVRSPSLYERYPWSTWQMAALMNNFVGDGNGYIGNPALKPEKAYTAAARLRWQQTATSGWQVEWRPYYTVIDDYIDAVQWDATTNAPRATPLTRQFTVLKYVNQKAKLYGHELTVNGPVAENSLGRWRLGATLACSRGSNEETGDNLYGLMPRNVKLRLTQEQGPWSQQLIVEGVERKSRVNRMRNEIPTSGYALVHWAGSWQWRKEATLLFGVDNLFDRSYELPLGGAYVGQGTTMTNPPLPNYPQWGTAVPGPGRTVWAGLRVRF